MRSREWKDKSGYTYGLHGTPTTFILEERLCALEGGLQCVLVPSGLAAIANVGLALLKPGDEVLIPDNAYGPGKDFANGELARFGITHAFYDPLDPADLAARQNYLSSAETLTSRFNGLNTVMDELRGDRMQVDDAVDAVVVFLQRDEFADRAKIVSEMEIAGRLNAGEYQRLELSHGCPQQAGGGPDLLIVSVWAYARRAGRNQALTFTSEASPARSDPKGFHRDRQRRRQCHRARGAAPPGRRRRLP